jgi:hypothetical protein
MTADAEAPRPECDCPTNPYWQGPDDESVVIQRQAHYEFCVNNPRWAALTATREAKCWLCGDEIVRPVCGRCASEGSL